MFFVYPAAVRMLDSATKFELTPEMQEELKELMKKVRCCPSLQAPLFAHTYLCALTIFWLDCGLQKKRGELSTQSKLLDEMMEHQEKRDAHETKLAKMQARITAERAGQKKADETADATRGDAKGKEETLRQRKGAKPD